tara:strand:- start:1456 stop:3132 length:1677 start_codon:yes stop_codon:yes gene_type:complete
MAFILSDRVKETTSTTGTGTYTLGGASTGFESFGSIGNSNTTYYCCTDGTDFEVGIGTYTASGTTLARTTILQSSNSDNEVNWSSGTREIFCTLPAEKAVVEDASNNINGTFVGNITGNVTGNVSGTAATVTGAAQSNITSVGTLTGLTSSGTINLSQTSGVAIKTTGALSTADLTLLRASASTDGEFGFDIKYMGSRSGNNNSYSLFMHNQTGTDVEAMTVFQDGKVGINQTTPTAPLHVGGAAIVDNVLEAGVLEGKGGVTYDPPGSSGSDTATDVALAVHSGDKIVLGDQGYIRTIINATWASALKFGQSGTSAFAGTEIYGGNAGVTLKYGTDTKLVTTSTGATITGTLISDGITLGDSEYITCGASSNLQIGFNGNNSVVADLAAGSLSMQSNGTEINFWDRANSQYMARFFIGDRSELQFNGSTKLTTTNTGVTVTGLLSATTKSFDIEHPTKHNMRLKHGSLEGPEHGVYVRGILTDENVIELPDYWTGLVHEDSITAQLTPKGHMQQLYVKEIRDNKVYVENTSATKIDCFYFIQGNRKDTEGFDVEYES